MVCFRQLSAKRNTTSATSKMLPGHRAYLIELFFDLSARSTPSDTEVRVVIDVLCRGRRIGREVTLGSPVGDREL